MIGNVSIRAKLIDHVGDLLGLQQLAGLNVLGMHLALLCGQSVDILLDVLEAGVHECNILLMGAIG